MVRFFTLSLVNWSWQIEKKKGEGKSVESEFAEFIFLVVLLPVLRPAIGLCSLFKVRYVIGWINHDIVGLCSNLLMRLSCYIQLGYGKSFLLTWESNQVSPDCETSTLHLDQII